MASLHGLSVAASPVVLARSRIPSVAVALSLAAGLLACAAEAPAEGDEVIAPDEYADFEGSPEKREVIDRLVERRPQVRELLIAGVAGETDTGYLAPPPSGVEAYDAERALLSADNDDRRRLYELIVHDSVIDGFVEQIPELVDQVASQACPQLQERGIPCTEAAIEGRILEAFDAIIAGEAITSDDLLAQVALAIVEPAVQGTLEVVVPAVTPEVERRFGAEYQRRAPAGTWLRVAGEWIPPE